jgi:hypothetical protein
MSRSPASGVAAASDRITAAAEQPAPAGTLLPAAGLSSVIRPDAPVSARDAVPVSRTAADLLRGGAAPLLPGATPAASPAASGSSGASGGAGGGFAFSAYLSAFALAAISLHTLLRRLEAGRRPVSPAYVPVVPPA